MILKGTANRGVKLLGTEVGAWLVDGINNDFQIIKNLVSHWTTITTGTIGGSATVAADTITLQQGTNSIWMAAYASFSTVIGETYSVSGNILDSSGNVGYVGAATTIVASPSIGSMDLGYEYAGVSPSGLTTHTFTATTTTTYVYLISGDGAAGFKVFKNEAEIRHAEVMGADTVTELHTYANAASDPNGNEANAITGFNVIAGTTAASVASPVSVGTYAISAETNTTPTVNGRVYLSLEDAEFDLVDGRHYKLTFNMRHNGTGGDWFASLGEFSTGSVTTIATVTSADTTYTTYGLIFSKNVQSKFLTFMEINASNNGGVYIDNLSIKESNEIFGYQNAAADPAGLEENSTEGWSLANNAVLSSVASPVDVGTYAISGESNTTPTNFANIYLDMADAVIGLIEGVEYIVSLRARHNGTGGAWLIRITGSTFNLSLFTLTNTDTTYAGYSHTFIHDLTGFRYLQFIENNATNDGGVYVDNLSIRRAIPDLSSVNKGLAIYGRLNKHVVNVNADTVSYSDFSSINHAVQPYSSDLDFDTTGFTIQGWFKIANVADGVILDRGAATGSSIRVRMSSDKIRVDVTDDAFATQDLIISDATIIDNLWHHIAVVNDAINLNLYMDGEIAATAVPLVNAVGSLSNSIATLTVGIYRGLTAPWLGELSPLKMGPTILTAIQVKNIYNKEKILFERDSVHQVVDLGLDLNIERPSAINETPGGIRSSIPSDDGTARETIYQRRQKTHSASSGPVEQKSVKYITNFLDTVNEGQAFSYDPYGAENAPCDPRFVWLESASYQPVRDGDTNWFTTSFSMLERN